MEHVKLIVLDVDGTLTDGTVLYDQNGGESKAFHVADGLGIVMAQAAGLRVAVVSGRRSAAVERRMAELRVEDCLLGIGDKASCLRDLMAKYHLQPQGMAFVGDDINDLPAFDVAGTRIAVADASLLVRDRADWVTPRAGGRGAVRDAVEEILHRQGRLDQAVTAYLAQQLQRAPSARQ
jgi:3-deoxy-D-manno-octulosonate 8-phosphate phosphatase (KDO 8-P phosphatase)